MSEKVWREFCEDCGCPLDICCKPKKPVRLASESVDLKALKEYCKTHETLRDCIARDSLIEWAEKEAKKNEDKVFT